MSKNYTIEFSGISFTQPFLKTFKNVKRFSLKNLILMIVFCFGDEGSGKSLPYTSIRSVMKMASVISVFDFIEGDYRPLNNNVDFSQGGSSPYYWETYIGGVWTPTAISPQAVKPARIIIHKPGITGGASSAHSYNDIIIANGGELILADKAANPTQKFLNAYKFLQVENGGKLIIRGDIDLHSTANLVIMKGGSMILEQNSITNIHPMWNGIETFEEGSTVTIKDWKWNGLASERSLIYNSSSISNNVGGYKFGNLVIDINPTHNWTIIGGSTGIINLCENDLYINNSSNNFITGASHETGINGFLVNGNMTINKGPFGFGSSFNNLNFNHQFIINGNFECKGNSELKIHYSTFTPTDLNGFVTFKGNVIVAPSVSLFTNDVAALPADKKMYINFDGGTSASPLLVDVAPTAVAISMNVKANSYVQLKGHDLNTNSIAKYTAIITVENGGTLDFNWALDGITPLHIKKNSTGGMNSFVTQQGSTLKITSPDGIQQVPTTGNVQYSSTNKNYNQAATFWYIGKTNQVTGTGLGTSGSARQVIIEMADHNLSTTLTQTFTLTNATTASPTGGKLDIRKGQFIETPTAFIGGVSNENASGTLYMSEGTLYKITSLSSADVQQKIPRMSGVSFPYKLDGGTIELSAAGAQTLRGNIHYRNLTFSNSGIKTVSGAPSSITGTILVADNAILNVGANTMGGAGTNFTMTGNSQYITAGVLTKPDAQGTYSLGTGTTIEFTNSLNLTMQDIRLGMSSINPIAYNHIIVSGSNVGNSSLASTPITMQRGSKFTVTNTGTFKHQNVNGFSGTSNTCVTDVPTINLEDDSTIDYYRDGTNQNISNQEPYKNLLLSGSGNKTSPAGNLMIQGNLTKTGTANFVHNNGTVILNGTIIQTYKSTNPVMLFYNLTNNNTTGLQINNDLEVHKELSLGAGSRTILNTGNIVLKSDKNNTANVGKIPGDAKIIYNAGRFVVERYINTGLIANGQHLKSWQFLSTPAFGESVYSTWQENKTSPNNYGIWITNNDAANWNAQGFDGYSLGGPSMKTYDAASDRWIGIASTNINLENKKGYMLFVRGDRTVNVVGQDAKPTTLRTRGKLYYPEIGFTPQPVSVPANSYGSIGNPYASRIDLEYMFNNGLLAGIDQAFYVWDPLLYGSYGVGGYQTISKSLGYKPVPGIPGNPTQYYDPAVKSNFIESGQAFFVHNSSGFNGTVSFNEDCKAKESRLVNREISGVTNNEILKTYLYTQNGIIADGNAVVFGNDFSNSIDADDALKMTNGGENFGLLRDEKLLAVEARKPVENTDTIFYNMRNLSKQTYQLKFDPENMRREFAAVLIDKFLQSKTPLNMKDSSVLNFSVTDDPASTAMDRFMLVFHQEVALPVTFASVKAYRQNANILVEWKVENETNISNYSVEKSADGNGFISTNNQTAKNNLQSSYNFLDETPFDGYNYYRIKSAGTNGEIKYSGIVRVFIGKENPLITVYPNPVKNGIVNLQLINQPAGIYRIRLLNSAGQIMVSKEITHAGGRGTESISFSKYASHGVYQLEVIKPAGEKSVVRVRSN